MRALGRWLVLGLMFVQYVPAFADNTVGGIIEEIIRGQINQGGGAHSTSSNTSSRASAQYGDVVFSDDFGGIIDEKKWRVADGDWLAADGCLFPDGLKRGAQAKIVPVVSVAPGYVVCADIFVPAGCNDDYLTIFFSPAGDVQATYGFIVRAGQPWANDDTMYWMRWKTKTTSPIGERVIESNNSGMRTHRVILRIGKDQSSYGINGGTEVACSSGIGAKGTMGIRIYADDDRGNSQRIKLDKITVYKPKAAGSTDGDTDTVDAVDAPVASSSLPIGSKEAAELAAELKQEMPGDNQPAKPKLTGIATFDTIGISDQAAAKQFAECLYTAMFKQGFKLVDRGKIDKIMAELKIQQSGLTDPETIKKIGKQANCDYILLGSISASKKKIIINARLDETETGEVVSVGDVEVELPAKGK